MRILGVGAASSAAVRNAPGSFAGDLSEYQGQGARNVIVRVKDVEIGACPCSINGAGSLEAEWNRVYTPLQP